jgi:plasmid stability protein
VPALTLKNLPEDMLAELRATAERNQRSLNQQALVLLKRGLHADATGSESGSLNAARVAAWRELCGAWQSEGTVEREVRAIYRRRTKGRKVDL